MTRRDDIKRFSRWVRLTFDEKCNDQLLPDDTDFRYLIKALKRNMRRGIKTTISKYESRNKASRQRLLSRLRTPKLATRMNPKSKYYDETPDLTKQLSLVWYTHQHRLKRYNHTRVTPHDRMWSTLVEIKNGLLKLVDYDRTKFLIWSRTFFDEAEKLFSERGRTPYLTRILSVYEELLDRTYNRMVVKITPDEREAYQLYQRMVSKLTGVKTKAQLISGSDEYRAIHQIVELAEKYRIEVEEFYRIHFSAFEHFNTFPRLQNMVTKKAIDRVEQYIYQKRGRSRLRGKLKTKDQAYWDSIKRMKKRRK